MCSHVKRVSAKQPFGTTITVVNITHWLVTNVERSATECLGPYHCWALLRHKLYFYCFYPIALFVLLFTNQTICSAFQQSECLFCFSPIRLFLLLFTNQIICSVFHQSDCLFCFSPTRLFLLLFTNQMEGEQNASRWLVASNHAAGDFSWLLHFGISIWANHWRYECCTTQKRYLCFPLKYLGKLLDILYLFTHDILMEVNKHILHTLPLELQCKLDALFCSITKFIRVHQHRKPSPAYECNVISYTR